MLAQSLKQKRKLLQAGLHFIFNAAVMLLLTRIVTSNTGDQASSSTSSSNPSRVDEHQSAAEIRFALNVFDQESKTGTNYPRDCYKVLKDLKFLVDRYLSEGHGMLRRNSSVDCEEGDDRYTMITTWLQSDAFELHEKLLI